MTADQNKTNNTIVCTLSLLFLSPTLLTDKIMPSRFWKVYKTVKYHLSGRSVDYGIKLDKKLS